MAQGIALTIGVNELDPAHYGGFSPQLYCSERDAEAMRYVAEQSGLTCLPSLLGPAATLSNVDASIMYAASELRQGDFFLISFAGHGAQVPDVTGTERDARNETWCLFDGELIEHGLFAALRSFASGVRVLIVSDCCHSGVEPELGLGEMAPAPGLRARSLPVDVAARAYGRHAPMYDATERLGNSEQRRNALSASVLLLASCREGELSYEGPELGFFTDALVQAWDGGAFSGDYNTFEQRINELSPNFQVPNLSWVSDDDGSFGASTPFSLGS
ncbi:MAG: caspase family protein [Gemmatimonadaceae bacterium]